MNINQRNTFEAVNGSREICVICVDLIVPIIKLITVQAQTNCRMRKMLTDAFRHSTQILIGGKKNELVVLL